MIIRKMTQKDIPEVASIERDCFSQPWSEKGFEDALDNKDAVFFVAEDLVTNTCGDDSPVILGYIGMYVSIDEGEITNVAVGEMFRGSGVGKDLIKELLSYAEANRIFRIVLEVRQSNAPAIGLYGRSGFARVGTRKNFYQFPRENADIMEWKSDNNIIEG